jgi:hypothetical protein
VTDESPYWAMYVQATAEHSGGRIRRQQWLVLPPLERGGDFLQFHREQPTLENRVQWRANFVLPTVILRDIDDRLNTLRAANENLASKFMWQISPVITAQVTPSELKTLHAEPKTPYSVLKRIEKVARNLHGIVV